METTLTKVQNDIYSPLTSDRRPSCMVFKLLDFTSAFDMIIPLCWTDLVNDMDLTVVF